MVEIRLTRRALAELNKIEIDSKKERGKIVANKYMDDIEDVLKTIAEYPNILREKPFAEHTRFFRIREHMFVFSMLDDILYLLTIKRGVMDMERIILRMEPTLIREAEIMHMRLKKEIN